MEGLSQSWAPARQCTATNRAGERCRRQPIAGGDVCILHGGAAPQVQRSARQRLLAGADLAIDYLLNLLTPKPPCEHCGRSDADRDPVVVRACQLVLDRAGFHPTLAVVHEQAPNEFEGLSVFAIADRAEEIAREARRMADAEAARLQQKSLPAAQDVQDGVLIDLFEVTDNGDTLWSIPQGDWSKEPESD
jgi:hypothetical protein